MPVSCLPHSNSLGHENAASFRKLSGSICSSSVMALWKTFYRRLFFILSSLTVLGCLLLVVVVVVVIGGGGSGGSGSVLFFPPSPCCKDQTYTSLTMMLHLTGACCWHTLLVAVVTHSITRRSFPGIKLVASGLQCRYFYYWAILRLSFWNLSPLTVNHPVLASVFSNNFHF